MKTRKLLKHFLALCSALLVNASLFMGIAVLCRDDPPDRAMTVAEPIRLASTPPHPVSEPLADTPPEPSTPRPAESVEEIPALPQSDEPQAAPEPLVEIAPPDLQNEIEPDLLTSIEVPQPLRKPKPSPDRKEESRKKPEPQKAGPAANPAEKPREALASAGGQGGLSEQSTEGASSAGGLSGEFGIEQVDQAPRVIERRKPVYPMVARRRNLAGRVTVKFLVDSHGTVHKPRIVEAHPQGVFEESVLESITKWRFEPGVYRGRKVATWVVLPVQFQLTGG